MRSGGFEWLNICYTFLDNWTSCSGVRLRGTMQWRDWPDSVPFFQKWKQAKNQLEICLCGASFLFNTCSCCDETVVKETACSNNVSCRYLAPCCRHCIRRGCYTGAVRSCRCVVSGSDVQVTEMGENVKGSVGCSRTHPWKHPGWSENSEIMRRNLLPLMGIEETVVAVTSALYLSVHYSYIYTAVTSCRMEGYVTRKRRRETF